MATTSLTGASGSPDSVVPGRLARRHGAIWIFFALFLGVALATRLALLVKAGGTVSWDASLVATFALGLLFDVGAAALASLPLVVALTLLPARWFERTWARLLAHACLFGIVFLLLFGAVSEWTFWDEFGARFNFIAVDYLVYTTEVLGNIRESYPMPLILGGILLVTALIHLAIVRAGWMSRWLAAPSQLAGERWSVGLTWGALALIVGLFLRQEQLPRFANAFNRELAKNGLWSLFAAFKNNVIDYDAFYRTMPYESAFARLRQELEEDGSVLLRPDSYDTLRYVKNAGPELHLNVIQITVESLSASYLGQFEPTSVVTPVLDALAEECLVFDNFYATGTRTDRGMEALALSLPPTPGRSIIKRPHNEEMFTLGSVFRSRGYDTAFIYGGFGYFDNMNYFFGHNGYRVVDRNAVSAEDVSYANVWGACDEDLYRWTLREADRAHENGTPFHYFVMTTSNHRPYTFPDGRIDLPSKTSGRQGAVKYTDFAIGEFLREAKTRPWFDDTVFVIVADHCASSAGRTELPVEKYHIPLMIYAPGGQIAPGHVSTLTSQMDYAPTLLGYLGWSYPSRFFGHDVRRVAPDEAHALLGNYQKLGHLEKDKLVVLGPQQELSTYRCDPTDGGLTEVALDEYSSQETISFYQTASYLYREGLYDALTPEEFERYTRLGSARALEAQSAGLRPR